VPGIGVLAEGLRWSVRTCLYWCWRLAAAGLSAEAAAIVGRACCSRTGDYYVLKPSAATEVARRVNGAGRFRWQRDCPPKCFRLLHTALRRSAACRRTTRWDLGLTKTRSGRSLARIDRDNLLQLAKIAAEVEARLIGCADQFRPTIRAPPAG
jgi:hypothetical protein